MKFYYLLNYHASKCNINTRCKMTRLKKIFLVSVTYEGLIFKMCKRNLCKSFGKRQSSKRIATKNTNVHSKERKHK